MIDLFKGTYVFLSNPYPVSISYDGWLYPSVEHAYQASKTASRGYRERIRTTCVASHARRLGRKAPMRPEFEGVKLAIMEDLLRQKFGKNPLRDWLINTGDQELIEGNYTKERFWGVYYGEGENHLGKLLMKIRLELQHPESVTETRQ